MSLCPYQKHVSIVIVPDEDIFPAAVGDPGRPLYSRQSRSHAVLAALQQQNWVLLKRLQGFCVRVCVQYVHVRLRLVQWWP